MRSDCLSKTHDLGPLVHRTETAAVSARDGSTNPPTESATQHASIHLRLGVHRDHRDIVSRLCHHRLILPELILDITSFKFLETLIVDSAMIIEAVTYTPFLVPAVHQQILFIGHLHHISFTAVDDLSNALLSTLLGSSAQSSPITDIHELDELGFILVLLVSLLPDFPNCQN